MPRRRSAHLGLLLALAVASLLALAPRPAGADGSPDLAASLVDDADPVEAGGTVTYTAVVTNLGATDTATGVVMRFEMFWDAAGSPPEVLGVTTSQGGPCAVTGVSGADPPVRAVDCPLGSLGPGGSAAVAIEAAASKEGTILADVEVSATEPDPNPVNNFAPQTTTVGSASPPPPPPGVVDVAVTAYADDADPVAVGDTITYSAAVLNLSGSDTANDVHLHFELFWDVGGSPPEVLSAVPSQGSPCTTGDLPAGDLPPIRTVDCALGALGPEAGAGVTLQVAASKAGMILSDVEVTALEVDPDTLNNFAPQTTTVVTPSVDLVVAKQGVPDSAIIGGEITYTITVTNDGPVTATGVTLQDVLAWAFSPSIPDVTAATTSQGDCAIRSAVSPRTVDCALGTLAPGGAATVTIVAVASQTGTLVDTATASATQPDSAPADNTVTVGTGVEHLPPVTISISETLHVSDNLVRVVPPVVITVSETVHVSDTQVQVLPPVVISVSEQVHLSDSSVDVVPPVTIAISESFTLSDSPAASVDPDQDDDGIVDLIDPLPLQPLHCLLAAPYTCEDNAFDDTGQGGVSNGKVLAKPPGVSLKLTDVADGGVKVAATGAGRSSVQLPSGGFEAGGQRVTGATFTFDAPATFLIATGSAVLEVLGGAVTVELPALGTTVLVFTGESLVLTETSLAEVRLTAQAGSPFVQVAVDGITATAWLTAGSALDLSQATETAPVVFAVAAGEVVVTANGVEVTLQPGDSLPVGLRTVEIVIQPRGDRDDEEEDDAGGGRSTTIKPRSRGTIAVAILSTPDFSAPALVERGSLTFGRSGDEQSLQRRGRHGTPDCSVRDVDRNRIRDLVCRFRIHLTGLQPGDSVGILRGRLLDGMPIAGEDDVVVGPAVGDDDAGRRDGGDEDEED